MGAGLLAAPSAGAGGQAGFGCPPGFDLGGNTVGQALLLPRIQAGLAAGFGDTAGFVSFFNTVDHNGDGVLCVKTNPAGEGSPAHWLYAYNFVDDNASVSHG